MQKPIKFLSYRRAKSTRLLLILIPLILLTISRSKGENKPFKLTSWSAAELAKMPTYYIMDLDKGMAECVATEMPSPSTIEACKWLTDEELMVYKLVLEAEGAEPETAYINEEGKWVKIQK